MLDKIAKGAKRLPVAAAIITTAAVASVGTAYALNDDGDEGTVTIEQVASEPAPVETTEPAPVVTTSEPAPVVAEPVASTTAPEPVAEETTVAPKPEPKPRLALIPDSRGPEYPPTDPNTAEPPPYPEDTVPAPEPYRPPAD